MIFEKQILNMYKGMMHTRCDDTETVFYFSPEDFPGLNYERYTFTSYLGDTLVGYIYSYENPMPKRLVVFDHGFGGGHRAYMKEIEKLCAHGYTVFSYDHTGCMESEGKSPRGLAQSLSDLNDCLFALEREERFSGYDIAVMGHSWGAFSTLNIAPLHPDISHIVAMCGFVSVEEMIKTFFGGILKGYRKAVLNLERETNPEYVKFNAIESIMAVDIKALLIYSADDTMCRKHHYDLLKAGLENKKGVTLMLTDKKWHNPNYTEDAVKLLLDFSKKRAKFARKKNITKKEKEEFVSSFDWKKMTEQDEDVWNAIFAHLDN